jgi:hypothetical protein
MKTNRMWGAAAVVAAMTVATSVMAGPIREAEPIDRSWDSMGAQRGQAVTETRIEPEPVEVPGMGGADARRGWASVESMMTVRYGTLVFDLAQIRRAFLGR